MRQAPGRTASRLVISHLKQKRIQPRERLGAAEVEALEPRRLLSAYSITVNDTADALDNPATVTAGALASNVTLRDAINAANNTGGQATIVGQDHLRLHHGGQQLVRPRRPAAGL